MNDQVMVGCLRGIMKYAARALEELESNQEETVKLVLIPEDDDVAADILQQLPQAKFPIGITFGDWLQAWFETYKKPVIRSARQMEIAIRLHIPDWIKAERLDALTPAMIQRAINGVNTSRNRETVYNIYTDSLRQARIDGRLHNDPMLGLRKPKHKRDPGVAFTRHEQAEFLALIRGNDCERYFIHLLLTGSRPSEPLRLRPEDIDTDHNQLHIRGTKTDGADRYIPLFSGILDNLRAIAPKNGRYFPYGYEYYQARMEKLHYHGHTLKDFRHTFATRGLEAGVSMRTMQLWLGHSTYDQTANTYSHVQPLYQEEQASQFRIDLSPLDDPKN